MRRNHANRLIAFLLSMLMLIGCAVPLSAADSEKSSSSQKTLKEISETLNAISYTEYRERHEGTEKATKTVRVNIVDYDKAATDADVEVRASVTDAYGETKENCLYVGDAGKVVWSVDIPETGYYSIEISYCSESEKTNSIERVFYINDRVPFSEARYLSLSKYWVHQYDEETGRFRMDASGNELRPTTECRQKWMTYEMQDSNGYYVEPFEFCLEKGTNTLALEGVREDIVIASIELKPLVSYPTYAEVEAEYQSKGYTEGTDEIYITAEMPSAVSNYTLYPVYDRSSAITEPQHATRLYLNTIGSGGSSGADKYATVGEWIEWEFEIENAGLYTIVPRFKQSEMQGMFSTRRLTIDGEVPFEEANYIVFDYDSSWQVSALTDGNHEGGFQFYLEPGVHTIRLEVSLGSMAEVVRRISESMSNINTCYLEITKLTGANPDEYRDYGFTRVMPETIEQLILESINLREIIAFLEGDSGVKSQYSSTLEQIAILLRKMGTDEDEIAKNLDTLKSDVGTIGTWISNVTSQPLEIDYILVQGASAEVPKAEAGFFTNLWHELKMFFGSFFTDYSSLGGGSDSSDGTSISAWVVTGRDQAQIMRNLLDNRYTPESGNKVDLKLVASGTLLPSVLAGVGPDLALDGVDVDPIQYAIRGAVLPLNEFDTFEEVTSRFTEAAMIPLTLYGETYALPTEQSFYMMFYRKDILADLGLEVPETWDDLLAMVPILEFNNMEVGIPNSYNLFLYQSGGELWTDNGMRINLDSQTALEAFETMCNMFTQYSLPYTYDFANRFRTGEMPIGIQLYTTYNQLILFASELAGLWEMAPIPGIEDENGNINNVSIATVSSICMMKGVRDKEAAWDLMDWWVGKEFQVEYANELVAVMGPAAKNATANREALEELPWSSSEFESLNEQMDNLAAITSYPGSYIIDRYTNFAFLDAYNDLLDPVDSLLDYINTINKEINRKRKEFDYETLELGQTLAEKRMSQAGELMEQLSGYQTEVAAATEAIANENIEALYAAAEAFQKAGSDETLTQIATYLTEAAAALASYQ